MITIPLNISRKELNNLISTANCNIERAEVILTNLLALRCETECTFKIPHDDVVITIETAIKILRES